MDFMKGFASKLRGLDTSAVETTDEQEAPTVEVDSPEEKALLAKLEELLPAFHRDETPVPLDIKLMCLRGRKYDPSRGAELVPKLLALREELGLDTEDRTRLNEDLRTNKIVATGAKDAQGRSIIWLRLRFHNPKESKARDMARLMATVMLDCVLRDPEAQRRGVVILQDFTEIKLKNLDPSAIKLVAGTVLPRLPVRVGRFCLFNPPWFVGHVVLPLVMTFMSPKLKSRLTLVKSADLEALHAFLPPASLTADHGGSFAFDGAAWAAGLSR